MAYTPNTWTTGDTITAAKLNNMEQGIASAYDFVVTATWSDSAGGYTLDKTATQIATALSNGQKCRVEGEMHTSIIGADSSPGGTMLYFDTETLVDPWGTTPLLYYLTYDFDPSVEVVMKTEDMFVLTPAS